MENLLTTNILNKIFENLNFSLKKGIIIASPSTNPPYKFHWIRDAALSMRVLIAEYKKTKDATCFRSILDYIENEYSIQNLDTLTGLGEPKINIDCTPYNEPWGRPQNDGPALRCINFIEIYNLLKENYTHISSKLIVKSIEMDIKYIINNYNKTSFDLWEEIKGWHFYTRMVQLKCLKDYILFKDEFDKFFTIDCDVNVIYDAMLENIKHHFDEDLSYISSFDENGNIIRKNDASLILAFCHISYDKDIIKELPIDGLVINKDQLIKAFRNKYNNHEIHLIGRYENDKYYDGSLWVLCCFALGQFYMYLANSDSKYLYLKSKVLDIISQIMSIDENFNLPEQFDLSNNKISAKKLTWNYSELYFLTKMLS